MIRANSAAVRNPIAANADVAAIIGTLSERERAAVRAVLLVLSRDWRARAEKSWRTHKPPMAAYWKQNAVNARHLAGALMVRK